MCFSIPNTNFNFLFRIILLSANALNLDKPEILSFGKELSVCCRGNSTFLKY